MISQNFLHAVRDYQYLVDQGYLPRNILDLVGNRHELKAVERSMLYRGIFSEISCQKRSGKMVKSNELSKNDNLIVDGLNVIITIASYLQGLPVFIATDGLVRDASNVRAKIQTLNKLTEATRLLKKYLPVLNIQNIEIYLNSQVESSMEISIILKEIDFTEGANVFIKLQKDVDRSLIESSNGIVCTSDTGIIDKTDNRIFDLASAIIYHHYNPQILDLGQLG
jgi:hypothetical protein